MRIHIIGGSGSGKTTAAAKLGAQYSLPVHDLDSLFWANGYGVRAPVEARNEALSSIASGESWVIEGVYCGWVSPSFERADLIILLTPSVWVRHWRIIKRFLARRLGFARSEKKETLAGLWRLLRWNHHYDTEMLQPARLALRPFQHKVVECKTVREVMAVIDRRDPPPRVPTSHRVRTPDESRAWSLPVP